MPSKKPAKKAPPQRYYLVEEIRHGEWYTVHLGRFLSVAQKQATCCEIPRITTYVREILPRKRRSKR